ncbi:MAG: radical SAM protein [Deltaproteobacteria bacterium]|nr:radical SAM protein [Deltaproteobacteria bacterium]
MRILALNPPFVPGFCRSARWAAKSRGRVQRHPDWFLIAVAVLERAGHEVRFVDGAALDLAAEVVDREALAFRPDLAVLHTTTPSIYSDLGHARRLKEKTGTRLVLIGPHPTALPDDTLRLAGDGVDALALGEFDETLLELADLSRWDDVALRSVAGLAFRNGSGEVERTAPRAPVDVNALPFPAWHHIQPEWYPDAGKRFPFLTLLSGRGCPGRCTFCRDVPLMEGRKLRLLDPARVVDEMEHDLKLFPRLREVMIETDTFTAVPAHVEGVCEELLRRNLKVTWSCNSRVDLDLSLLPLMRRAGCRMLMVGFEFGTQQALDAVKKGITLEQSRRFARAASELGFTLHGCFMIGAPGETRESARATIDFAKSLPLDTIQVSGICVYPGTELYDWAKTKGYLVPKDWTEWVGPDCEQATLLDYPELSKAEIDALIDRGLREFYLRPGQMLRMAKSLRSWDDLKRKLYGLKSFLDYFGKPKAEGRP